MFFARDTARGMTPKRRGSARLFPLFIKHQTSYIKHVLMDPFSYLSVLISIILVLGMTRVLGAAARCFRHGRVAGFIGYTPSGS